MGQSWAAIVGTLRASRRHGLAYARALELVATLKLLRPIWSCKMTTGLSKRDEFSRILSPITSSMLATLTRVSDRHPGITIRDRP